MSPDDRVKVANYGDDRVKVAKFYYGDDFPIVHAMIGEELLCRPGQAFAGWASMGLAPVEEVNCMKCKVLIAGGKLEEEA